MNLLQGDLGNLVSAYPQWAVLIAFAAGLATSLGPCTFSRTLAFAGFIGREASVTRMRGLGLAVSMNAGSAVSLSLMGLVGGIAANVTRLGPYIYGVAGVAIIVMGIAAAGVLKLTIPVPAAVARLGKRVRRVNGYQGAFGLGVLFGLMLCPCCLPGLLGIYALTFAQGSYAFGILLVVAFTFGHNVPVLVVGGFAGALGRLKAMQRWRAHFEVGMGAIMVVGGMLLLWLA